MAHATRQRARRRTVVRRRRLATIAVLALAITLSLAVARGLNGGGRPGTAVLLAPDRPPARIALSDHVRRGRLNADSVRRTIRRRIPRTATIVRGRARVTYDYDVDRAVSRVLRRGLAGGRVEVARRPVSATVRAPILKQAQANTCESAALAILMGALGRDVDQTELQGAFPTSGPLDPDDRGTTRVWGDPDRGYVGRPDGGGVAGGFGVLQGPVRSTARRYGIELQDLTGRAASAIYSRLRTGRPVMAWVGLSDGPYGSWATPDGRQVRVNFGEHTIVLYGIRADGRLLLSNPLQGTDEVWAPRDFEVLWNRLDRRALGA